MFDLVDDAAIEAYARSLRRRKVSSLALRLRSRASRLPAITGAIWSSLAIDPAVNAFPLSGVMVYPIEGDAVCAVPADSRQWRSVVDRVRSELGDGDLEVAAARLLLDVKDVSCITRHPSLVLAFRGEVPQSELPRNAAGVPQLCWNVSQAATSAHTPAVTAWATQGATHAEMRLGPIHLPVDAAAATTLLNEELATNTPVVLEAIGDRETFRTATWSHWGALGLSSVTQPPFIDLAAFRDILASSAGDLDAGFIGWAHPSTPSWTSARYFTSWPAHRDRWAEFVVDAFGVQVVNSSQLSKANDLTGWVTTKVADDRWLLEWPDLREWLGAPEDQGFGQDQIALVEQAREAFGDMIWPEGG